MCKNDDNVSPYLRRRLRSYRQAMSEHAEKLRKKIQSERANGAATVRPVPEDRERDFSSTCRNPK